MKQINKHTVPDWWVGHERKVMRRRSGGKSWEMWLEERDCPSSWWK